jgi:hypothetical protein
VLKDAISPSQSRHFTIAKALFSHASGAIRDAGLVVGEKGENRVVYHKRESRDRRGPGDL